MGRVAKRHFVQIEYKREKIVGLYRFFGRGEWKVKDGRRWRTVNGIYIPADVLHIVASYCQPNPPPILTEMDIALLCGAKVSPHGQ